MTTRTTPPAPTRLQPPATRLPLPRRHFGLLLSSAGLTLLAACSKGPDVPPAPAAADPVPAPPPAADAASVSSPGTTGAAGRPSPSPAIKQYAFLLDKTRLSPQVALDGELLDVDVPAGQAPVPTPEWGSDSNYRIAKCASAAVAMVSPCSCTKCPACGRIIGSGQPRITCCRARITGSPSTGSWAPTAIRVWPDHSSRQKSRAAREIAALVTEIERIAP